MDLQEVSFPEAIARYRSNELDEIRAWASTAAPFTPPIQVEIGSNRGRFIQGLAQLYPERSLLGVEWQRKWARLSEQDLRDAGLDNARVLHADVNLALPMLFPDGALERVYVLFPDPWWKRRHAKRRLFTPEFLQLLAAKIAPGGHLVIKTDVEPYAEHIEQLTSTLAQFQATSPGDPGAPDDVEAWPKTTRERKIIRKGLPVWRFFLRRTEAPPTDNPGDAPLPELFDKPDVTIDNPRQ